MSYNSAHRKKVFVSAPFAKHKFICTRLVRIIEIVGTRKHATMHSMAQGNKKWTVVSLEGIMHHVSKIVVFPMFQPCLHQENADITLTCFNPFIYSCKNLCVIFNNCVIFRVCAVWKSSYQC